MSECEGLTNTWKGRGKLGPAPRRMGTTPTYHLQGRSQAQTRGLPLVIDQSCSIYHYKYYTRRHVRGDSWLLRLLDGRGCTLSAHSYAVSFHCILINTWLNQARTTLLISQDKRTRQMSYSLIIRLKVTSTLLFGHYTSDNHRFFYWLIYKGYQLLLNYYCQIGF